MSRRAKCTTGPELSPGDRGAMLLRARQFSLVASAATQVSALTSFRFDASPRVNCIDRLEHTPKELVSAGRIQPANDNRHPALRLDPGKRATRTDAEITRRRHARKDLAISIEPYQVAIKRCERTRRSHARNPFARQNAPAVHHAVIQQHLRDLELIVRADRHSAAPMRSARNGLHALSVDLYPCIVVADPLPVFTRASRAHYRFAENLGQRL